MPQLIRTTITMPKSLNKQLKLKAAVENSSVSALITEIVEKDIFKGFKKKKKDPLEILGKFNIGIKKAYNKRSELYEKHLKRKVGI